MALTIEPARDPEDIPSVRELFIEYQEWLQIDL